MIEENLDQQIQTSLNVLKKALNDIIEKETNGIIDHWSSITKQRNLYLVAYAYLLELVTGIPRDLTIKELTKNEKYNNLSKKDPSNERELVLSSKN